MKNIKSIKSPTIKPIRVDIEIKSSFLKKAILRGNRIVQALASKKNMNAEIMQTEKGTKRLVNGFMFFALFRKAYLNLSRIKILEAV